MTEVKLMLGNCLDRLKDLDDNSVDSIVTDPPYGIDFMGKKWDYDVPSTEIWEQAMRVLKPGGYLLAFAGTRTQHRMAVRIEDAGFEIRDMIAWVYGSGFPKSHNISKSLDKMAGADREVVGTYDPRGTYDGKERSSKAINTNWRDQEGRNDAIDNSSKAITAPATDEAKQWDGWGTALKPALEPITVARKPLEEKTVAKNVLKYGTGGINIDASRVGTNQEITNHSRGKESAISKGKYGDSKVQETHQTEGQKLGRFPANLIHDGSEEVTSAFPHTKGRSNQGSSSSTKVDGEGVVYGKYTGELECGTSANRDPIGFQEGSAARFFYVPKTSKKDRNDGLENFTPKATASSEFRPNHAEKADNGEDGNPYGRWTPTQNNHPTVKPTDLMRYLVTMVTPKGGTTLDPFMGSGSTGRGAKLGGFNFIGIELDENYLEIAKARIDAISTEVTLEEFFK